MNNDPKQTIDTIKSKDIEPEVIKIKLLQEISDKLSQLIAKP